MLQNICLYSVNHLIKLKYYMNGYSTQREHNSILKCTTALLVVLLRHLKANVRIVKTLNIQFRKGQIGEDFFNNFNEKKTAF